MILLTVDKIIYLHSKLITKTGGSDDFVIEGCWNLLFIVQWVDLAMKKPIRLLRKKRLG